MSKLWIYHIKVNAAATLALTQVEEELLLKNIDKCSPLITKVEMEGEELITYGDAIRKHADE